MKRPAVMLLPVTAALGGALAWAGERAQEGERGPLAARPGLGDGLRALSLSGAAGNLAAWALVILAAALPVLALIPLARRRGLRREDVLAPVLSALIFALCYFGANPTLLGEGVFPLFRLAGAGAAVSVVAAWFALSVLRGLEKAPARRLAAALSPLLTGCALLLALGAGYGQTALALERWGAVKEGNFVTGAPPLVPEGIQPGLGPTLAVLWAVAVLRLLPDLLAALALMWGAELGGRLGTLDFGGETLALCGRVAGYCKGAAQATVALAVLANLLQLALLGLLRSTNFSVDFPLFPLALSAALYLLCRCLQRGKELQDDSASII